MSISPDQAVPPVSELDLETRRANLRRIKDLTERCPKCGSTKSQFFRSHYGDIAYRCLKCGVTRIPDGAHLD